jgi:hypothetical protein
MITKAHDMGSCYKTPFKCTEHPPYMTPPIESYRARGDAKVCGRTPPMGNYSGIMESLCSKLLFHQEKRWEAVFSLGLPTNQ